MDKKTEALKLALEALEYFYLYAEGRNEEKMADKAITALREALAEPAAQQQELASASVEPVAFEIRAFNATQAIIKRADVAQEKADVLERGFGSEADVTIVPLYTSPPASKPWVGLTEEDIEAAMPGGIYDCLADPWDCGVGDGDYMRSIKNDVVRIVRAIEAKLKEKNT